MAKVFLEAGRAFQLCGGSMMSVGSNGTVIGAHIAWESSEAYRGDPPADKPGECNVLGCIQLPEPGGNVNNPLTYDVHLDPDTNALWYDDNQGY